MRVKSGLFLDLAENIKNNQKKVVIFGAGVIGTVTVPGVFYEYGIEDAILCYVDNDSRKHGKFISLGKREVMVYPASYLESIDLENTVILMTLSRYSSVLQQLEDIEYLSNIECYMIPLMCMDSFQPKDAKGVIFASEQPLIPKVIHYMWLGGKTLPDKLKYCVESWQKFCPDYTIKCWDESNYDIESHPYMKQAYEAGKYGFVPDYARIDILYRFGGIYMDTDVELKKSLDNLLYQQAFCSVEKWQIINLGGCSGAVPGHPAVRELLREREKIEFLEADGSLNLNTCGYYDTRVMLRNGYRVTGKIQTVLGMNIYPYDYFHPYDYMSGRLEMTSDTFGVHHFNGGWLDKTMCAENERAVKEFEELYAKTKQSESAID